MRRSTLSWQLGLLAVALVVMVLNWVGLWEPIQDWLIGGSTRWDDPTQQPDRRSTVSTRGAGPLLLHLALGVPTRGSVSVPR